VSNDVQKLLTSMLGSRYDKIVKWMPTNSLFTLLGIADEPDRTVW